MFVHPKTGSLGYENITDDSKAYLYKKVLECIKTKEYLYPLLEIGFFSFILTYLLIPKILEISYKKGILTLPNERSSHIKSIPHLGGMAIFFSIIICSQLFIPELKQGTVAVLIGTLRNAFRRRKSGNGIQRQEI